MLRLLNRTSTYAVFEILTANDKIIDAEFIQSELYRKWNFNRQIHDIRNMLKHLQRIGIIKYLKLEPLEYELHPISRIVFRTSMISKNDDLILGNINDFIDFLSKNGLLVRSFLKAVRDYPNKLGRIIESLRDYSKEEGVYNLYVDGPSISAMRNFFQLFNLLEKTDRPGKYELTQLGENIAGEKQTTGRSRCSREYCREICPANAIHINSIEGCVGCGLCVRVCPYGAITFDPYNPTKPIFNDMICLKEEGNRKTASPVLVNHILAEESIMQNWIKAVLSLTNLKADIPGVGRYPDIVVEESSVFIECKNKPKRTEININKLINQIKLYSTDEVIESTIKRVKEHGFTLKYPELFLIITPPKTNTNLLIEKARENVDIPVSFVNTNSISRIAKYIVEGNSVEGVRLIEKIEPFSDSSKLLLELIN